MEEDEDAALEAVWGREASATAPPAPRPDLAGLFAPTEAPVAGPAPRRRRAPVVGTLAVVAVAVAVVAGVVVLGGGAEGEADPGPRPPGSSTAPPAPLPGPEGLGSPAWTAAVVCPRFEEDSGAGSIACPLATDDERAYALVDVGGTATLRAHDVASGQVRWEAAFPEGAGTLERLPSIVAVGGVGPANETVALDPATGDRLWSRGGVVVGPVGPDHLVVDATAPGGEEVALAVVEAISGHEVLGRAGAGGALSIHPCGDDTVLVSEGDRLDAHDVADGARRWSIPVPHRDRFRPVRCDARRIAYASGGTVHLLDHGGLPIGGGPVGAGADDEDRTQVVAIVGDTVVVAGPDGVRGLRVTGPVEQLWHHPCTGCEQAVVAMGTPTGDGFGAEDVALVVAGDVVVRDGADGTPGPPIDLAGATVVELADGALLARDDDGVTWFPVVGAGPALRIEVAGVRSTAVGPGHVVVATRDQLQGWVGPG